MAPSMNDPSAAQPTVRERIVGAARRLFEARGYASTTIADVAGWR